MLFQGAKCSLVLLALTALAAVPARALTQDEGAYDNLEGFDDRDNGYVGEENEEWWENSPYYNEDEAYDPTDWFDGNNYEYAYDQYGAGYDDENDDDDWYYDYYEPGYYSAYGGYDYGL